MTAYRGAHTTGQMLEYMRDDVIRALDGYVWEGYWNQDDEPVYMHRSKQECKQAVSDIFDEINYQMQQLAASGRAIDNIARKHGWKLKLKEYIPEVQAESIKFAGEYMSLEDKREIEQEAESELNQD